MAQWHAWLNPIVVDFPIRDGAIVEHEYETSIGNLRHCLAYHPERNNYIEDYGEWVRDHPLLPKQQAQQPARWIHVNLILQDEFGVEETRITIAIRDDNVYLKGFKNQHNAWYELGREGRDAHFIPDSNFLGCDVGYPGLVGGSANLVSLSLRKNDVIRTIRRLSEYQETAPANDETARHLARLCVIICECARMIPHHDKVVFHWNAGDRTGRQHQGLVEDVRGITAEQAGNIKDWSKMSKELLRDPNPEGNSYLSIVHLLLNTRDRISQQRVREQGQAAGGGGGGGESSQQEHDSCKSQMKPSSLPTSSSGGSRAQEQTGQTGRKSVRTRPLLEVFFVEAVMDIIGTIVVFDGKRGQIIYTHGRKPSRRQSNLYQHELALTGPYKAISAEGSFAVQVHGITSGTDTSDKSGKVMGEMLWDCYADDVVYNKVVAHKIRTGTGSIIAELRYAVWSEAVETTVEVNFLLPHGFLIHGHIVMYSRAEDHEEPVMLFGRREEEKVELVPSAADSTVPLELDRSVTAVPLLGRYSHQLIFVSMYVVTPNNMYDFHLGGSIHLYLDKHTGEIRIRQERDGDVFVPGGWPMGSDATRTGSTHPRLQVNIAAPGFHVSPLDPKEIIREAF